VSVGVAGKWIWRGSINDAPCSQRVIVVSAFLLLLQLLLLWVAYEAVDVVTGDELLVQLM